MKTLEEMKEFFKRDRFVAASGIEIIEVNDNYAICKAEISDKHLNAGDMVQGGMLFTICDFAFAVITNYHHPETISQTGFISFINACVGAKYITATAREMTKTRHNCVGEVTVHDDKGKVICISQFNGFIR
ncbi:MAG: PaaI family thioesterase, partial [Clostridia bacterium]|jgi:acyl-CoA thioesterase|nr:PaaI family thioesterase [Clostridia bacterium]NLT18002.1 PaaI family thioesterase [Clostridiales bacterium]